MAKTLAQLVRLALVLKAAAKKAGSVIGQGLLWFGRHLLLPVLVRIYRLFDRARRALRPAERRFVLIAAHRGILHGAIIAVAITTAGGNIYAQAQSTVSSGEGSVLYRYITGDGDTVEESGGPSSGDGSQYLANTVDPSSQDQAPADGVDSADGLDQGSDTMTELGALMPEIVPGAAAPVHRTQIETYTVADGDTLSGIASKFGVSIATILWENKMTARDFIKPGQKLTILPTSGITYKVKKGDTIAKIAAAYGVDAGEIRSWNGVTDDGSLQDGQNIIVPGGKVIEPPKPKTPKPAAVAAKPFVRPADASDDDTTDMIWPAGTHYISQPYGIWSAVDRGIHTGVDLAAPVGTPIYAADDGIVTHAGCGASGCKRGYGYYIDIDHGDGIATRYGHTSKMLVAVGDQVHRGQVIALMGSTGHSTGPHLHFEVRKNGHYINPMPYIR